MNNEIVNVIKAYEKSLNMSATQAALALYGSDPVFMPEFSVALSGRDAVKAGYDHVFRAISIDSVKAAFRFLAQRGLRRRALPKHSAREQIRSVDCCEIVCRDFASYRATDEPIGLTQTKHSN